jgi:hypothetical protein
MYPKWQVMSKTGGLLCVVYASTESLALQIARDNGHKPHSATRI